MEQQSNSPFPFPLWIKFHSIGISESCDQVLKVGDHWSPPTKKTAFMPHSYDRGYSEHWTELLPCRTPGTLRPDGPPKLQLLRASTLFWSTQRYSFLHLPHDCRATDAESLPDKVWAPLSFEPAKRYHASGTEIWKVGYHLREPQICSGINMSDSWRDLFGPTCFKDGDRTLNTSPTCDLTGDISILLGLAAFAARSWQDIPHVVEQLFQLGRRSADYIPFKMMECGQIHDRRGLVVEVYYDSRQTTVDKILQWEDGDFGPILRSFRRVRNESNV